LWTFQQKWFLGVFNVKSGKASSQSVSVKSHEKLSNIFFRHLDESWLRHRQTHTNTLCALREWRNGRDGIRAEMFSSIYWSRFRSLSLLGLRQTKSRSTRIEATRVSCDSVFLKYIFTNVKMIFGSLFLTSSKLLQWCFFLFSHLYTWSSFFCLKVFWFYFYEIPKANNTKNVITFNKLYSEIAALKCFKYWTHKKENKLTKKISLFVLRNTHIHVDMTCRKRNGFCEERLAGMHASDRWMLELSSVWKFASAVHVSLCVYIRMCVYVCYL
jgi:hypothetical protein